MASSPAGPVWCSLGGVLVRRWVNGGSEVFEIMDSDSASKNRRESSGGDDGEGTVVVGEEKAEEGDEQEEDEQEEDEDEGEKSKELQLLRADVATGILHRDGFRPMEFNLVFDQDEGGVPIAFPWRTKHPELHWNREIGEANKGHAMLKRMGWTPGSGLGKYNQGRLEPVGIRRISGRTGLGR